MPSSARSASCTSAGRGPVGAARGRYRRADRREAHAQRAGCARHPWEPTARRARGFSFRSGGAPVLEGRHVEAEQRGGSPDLQADTPTREAPQRCSAALPHRKVAAFGLLILAPNHEAVRSSLDTHRMRPLPRAADSEHASWRCALDPNRQAPATAARSARLAWQRVRHARRRAGGCTTRPGREDLSKGMRRLPHQLRLAGKPHLRQASG